MRVWLLPWLALASARQDEYGQGSGGLSADRGCKGMLKYPCVCDQVSVECVNGQFTTDEVFLNVGIHFGYLERVAFHGNNFNALGGATGHLFGAGVSHPRMRNLNLSANYIVKIHPQAFLNLPALTDLDLSNNELVLNDPESLPLLQPLPRLERLYMKKAFSRPSDYEANSTSYQLEILENVFRTANLQQLTLLDLSWNFLRFVPHNFACALPSLTHLIFRNNFLDSLSLNTSCLQRLQVRYPASLTHLIFRNNFLDSLSLNTSCLQRLQVLDLRGNSFQWLGYQFRLTAQALPQYSLLMERNDFHCDCHSEPGLLWLRRSAAVRDRDSLLCRLASPPRFRNAALLTVPLQELDCATLLSAAPTLAPALALSASLSASFSLSLCLRRP